MGHSRAHARASTTSRVLGVTSKVNSKEPVFKCLIVVVLVAANASKFLLTDELISGRNVPVNKLRRALNLSLPRLNFVNDPKINVGLIV